METIKKFKSHGHVNVPLKHFGEVISLFPRKLTRSSDVLLLFILQDQFSIIMRAWIKTQIQHKYNTQNLWETVLWIEDCHFFGSFENGNACGSVSWSNMARMPTLLYRYMRKKSRHATLMGSSSIKFTQTLSWRLLSDFFFWISLLMSKLVVVRKFFLCIVESWKGAWWHLWDDEIFGFWRINITVEIKVQFLSNITLRCNDEGRRGLLYLCCFN